MLLKYKQQSELLRAGQIVQFTKIYIYSKEMLFIF